MLVTVTSRGPSLVADLEEEINEVIRTIEKLECTEIIDIKHNSFYDHQLDQKMMTAMIVYTDNR